MTPSSDSGTGAVHAAELEPGNDFLIFGLDGAEYGVDIRKVQEIRGGDPVAVFASAPECIRGVIELRGALVPILDLRAWFHLGKPQSAQPDVVIILSLPTRAAGIAVDCVADVLTLDAGQIRPLDEGQVALETRCAAGIAELDERTLILLDIERLIQLSELKVPSALPQ
jgi:purine-binding chemotaxis protein CheW